MRLPPFDTDHYWETVKADAHQLIVALSAFDQTVKAMLSLVGADIPSVPVGFGSAPCPNPRRPKSGTPHYHVFVKAMPLTHIGFKGQLVWLSDVEVPNKGIAQVYGLAVWEVAQGALRELTGEDVLYTTDLPFTN